jgi:hypothetical protein
MQSLTPQHSHLLKQPQLPTQTESKQPMHWSVSEPTSEHTLHFVFVVMVIPFLTKATEVGGVVLDWHWTIKFLCHSNNQPRWRCKMLKR